MEDIITIRSIHDKEKFEFKKSELIDLHEVFYILNRHSGLEGRKKRDMKKILFDESSEFPEIFFFPKKREYGEFPSYRGKEIFFLRDSFLEWCEERNIYIEK